MHSPSRPQVDAVIRKDGTMRSREVLGSNCSLLSSPNMTKRTVVSRNSAMTSQNPKESQNKIVIIEDFTELKKTHMNKSSANIMISSDTSLPMSGSPSSN